MSSRSGHFNVIRYCSRSRRYLFATVGFLIGDMCEAAGMWWLNNNSGDTAFLAKVGTWTNVFRGSRRTLAACLIYWFVFYTAMQSDAHSASIQREHVLRFRDRIFAPSHAPQGWRMDAGTTEWVTGNLLGDNLGDRIRELCYPAWAL